MTVTTKTIQTVSVIAICAGVAVTPIGTANATNGAVPVMLPPTQVQNCVVPASPVDQIISTSNEETVDHYLTFGDTGVAVDADTSMVLNAASGMMPLMMDAVEQIGKRFPPGTTLVARTHVDPESVSGREEVFLAIQTKLGAEEALALLDKFDDEWWLSNSERANGRLEVTIDFV